MINPVDKTKLSCYTLHWCSITVSYETYCSLWLLNTQSMDVTFVSMGVERLNWQEA